MKTLLLSITFSVFFASSLFSQTLIAHWPLDGDASEVVGGKNGVATGGVSYLADPTRGDCAQFDGVDGIITLPTVIWESETDTNTTIACWFNWAGGADWQRVYSLGMTDGAWQCMYYCPHDNSGSLHITFKTTVPDSWFDYTSTSFTNYDSISPNTWYFSAIILKEDSLKIWLNDDIILEIGEFPVTPQKIQPDISQNVLGKSHWPDATYNGMIDDFRIYSDALSDEQVLALYSGGTGIQQINTSFEIGFYGKDGRIYYSPIDESIISSVSVYSMSGKRLFSSNSISDLKNRQFDNGIYLVSVTNGKEHITRKVALFK